jgi:hypothetical protein
VCQNPPVSSALPHVYRYPFASHLDGPRLAVAPELRGADEPWFFVGRLAEPQRTAELLLVLHEVVRTRFFLPLNPALLDPVLTANDGVLRFEGFSSCASVYTRVDLPEEAVQASIARRGTTNVDFGLPMRAALGRIRAKDPVELAVGRDAVRLDSPAASVVEKKVQLPVRWIKGFTETAVIGARLAPRITVDGPEILRLLRSFPRSAASGWTAWVAPSGRGARVSASEVREGVPIAGLERLRLLERLAPGARRLTVGLDEATGATAWRLDTSTASLTMLLSPRLERGFSGEGQALADLVDPAWAHALPKVRAALRWQSRLEPGALAAEHGLATDAVRGALAALASRGLVGYDAAAGAFFHRELPFDLERVDELHPRLLDARRLLAEGGVRPDGDGRYWVRGESAEHYVRLEPGGDRCTCAWWAKHQGARGPCKHVLAAGLSRGDDDGG